MVQRRIQITALALFLTLLLSLPALHKIIARIGDINIVFLKFSLLLKTWQQQRPFNRTEK